MTNNGQLRFTNILGQGRVNQLGGLFINGRPLPKAMRAKIIELAAEGIKPCQISRQLRVSHGCVSKILNRYAETGSINPGKMGGSAKAARQTLMAFEGHIINILKMNPEVSASEIRHSLIVLGLSSNEFAPSISAIGRYLKSLKKKDSFPLSLFPSPLSLLTPSIPPIKHSINAILGRQSASPSGSSESSSSSSFSSSFDSRRGRTSFSNEQLTHLEAMFATNSYPNKEEREELSRCTRLSDEKIQVWFSNRRARCRKNLAGFNSKFTPKMEDDVNYYEMYKNALLKPL